MLRTKKQAREENSSSACLDIRQQDQNFSLQSIYKSF